MRVLPVFLILSLVVAARALGAASGALELRAAELTVRDGGQVIDARGNVRITDGRNQVRAERAVYSVRERRIELTGNVSIVTADGSLEAQRAVITLTVDRRLDAVDAIGAVELETHDRVLKADRMKYTVGSESITASGSVSLFIPPDIIATGQQLTARRASATLTGRAKVQNRDGYIEGDTVEFIESEQIAYVRGNVVSVVQDTKITAATATFYGRQRKAVFRDNVTIVRPGRTVKAALVTVFYEDKRIVAEGETTIRIEEERPGP